MKIIIPINDFGAIGGADPYRKKNEIISSIMTRNNIHFKCNSNDHKIENLNKLAEPYGITVKNVTEEMSKEYGQIIHAESEYYSRTLSRKNAIDVFEIDSSFVLNHIDEKVYSFYIGDDKNRVSYYIEGRVPYTDNDNIIVDIKNRHRCFFNTIPTSEKIVLECYMRLKYRDFCYHIQNFDGDQHILRYERDDILFNDCVYKAIDILSKELESL